jgi:hypothetical protein
MSEGGDRPPILILRLDGAISRRHFGDRRPVRFQERIGLQRRQLRVFYVQHQYFNAPRCVSIAKRESTLLITRFGVQVPGPSPN